MGRRRSEWPEPWTRLSWSPGDLIRLERLHKLPLKAFDRDFVNDMRRQDVATLQQVAFVRSLARRYKADPGRACREDPRTRQIEVE